MEEFEYSGFKFIFQDTNNYLFASISGSHAFGWNSKSSDLDIRVVNIPILPMYVDPFHKIKTTEWESWKVNNIDAVCYPITIFLGLLAKGNGNTLDNLFEEKIFDSNKTATKDLQDIVKNHLHKGFLYHCIGYSQCVKNDLKVEQRIIKYGYAKLLCERYRELLKGMLLCEGKIEYNLPKMMEQIPVKFADTLLDSIKECNTNWLTSRAAVVQNAIKETNQLEEQLCDMINKSNLQDKELSCIEVPLSQWIKKLYFGTKYEMGLV